MTDAGHLLVWDAMGDIPLAEALASPVLACIEVGEDVVEEIDSVGACLYPQGLLLSVSTAVVCRQNVAPAFAAAIARRIGLSDDTRDRMATAIQEAAVNAAVHGNLELGSELRDTLDGLHAFAAEIDQRLADPARARRRVRLRANWASARIVVDVHDDGAGYGADELPGAVDADAAKSGRGLAMLRILSNGVSLGRQSRVVHLFFDRS